MLIARGAIDQVPDLPDQGSECPSPEDKTAYCLASDERYALLLNHDAASNGKVRIPAALITRRCNRDSIEPGNLRVNQL